MVIGESLASVEGIFQAGNAHIFDLDGNLKITLQAPTPQIQGWFGVSVAIHGDIILVGEPGADIGDLTDAGRAYIYNSDGSLHATILSPTRARRPCAENQFYGSLSSHAVEPN